MINLKDLVLEAKQIEVAYPGMSHFKVTLNWIPRRKAKEIMENSTKTEWTNGTSYKTQDDEKFLQVFTEAAIAGWEGLTLGDVEKLLLIESDLPLETPVEFSIDNAMMLVKNSAAFDTWINTTVFNFDQFRTEKQG